jgi:hypothetical protein
LKHLKTYEALNLHFDEDEQRLIEQEEVFAADRRSIFLDYEEEFLEDVGFVLQPPYYVYQDAENYIMFCKQKSNPAAAGNNLPCYYCVVYEMQYGPYKNQIDYFQYVLDTTDQEDRLGMMKEIMRKVYVSINLKKKQEERKLRKQGLIKQKELNKPLSPDDKEWWNLPTK